MPPCASIAVLAIATFAGNIYRDDQSSRPPAARKVILSSYLGVSFHLYIWCLQRYSIHLNPDQLSSRAGSATKIPGGNETGPDANSSGNDLPGQLNDFRGVPFQPIARRPELSRNGDHGHSRQATDVPPLRWSRPVQCLGVFRKSCPIEIVVRSKARKKDSRSDSSNPRLL